VREYPSFPILVETYRDVLQDAFDMDGLRDVLGRIAAGEITIRVVATEIPSPFAASLQFGFVIDHMYGKDVPRAEERAALLSLDRALLDELMGGQGADEPTLAVLDELLARRRGTATGRQARDADELAVLVDRAGDVTREELEARVSPSTEWRKGEPIAALLASGRMIAAEVPTSRGSEMRYLLVDNYSRYAAAFEWDETMLVMAGPALESRPATEVVPEALRGPALTRGAARREVLSRFLALAGPVSVDEVRERYDFAAGWTERRLEEWERKGVLVRGVFGGDRAVARWCSRRLLEQARRRELAQARKQIEAVGLEAFARFLQRWQHLVPEERLSGSEGAAAVLGQMYGLARPGDGWERDYLSARVADYDEGQLASLAASGELVWAAVPRVDDGSGAAHQTVGRIRFSERGTWRLWLGEPAAEDTLSDRARAVLAALRQQGASFVADLQAATGLAAQGTRDGLHELVAAGLVTNDTVGALRDVLRWRPVFPAKRRDEPDPTRWLPADYVPSGRPIVQRRVNPRRLAKWKRPELEPQAKWGGRWSLVYTPGTLGPDAESSALAEQIARQWLKRYGVVAREWWKRERPAVGWREIYQELKRLEFRGDVRRGYFVAGLTGAQFALPEAVEMLRAPTSEEADPVVMSVGDPANVYSLPVAPGVEADPLARPRGAGALLVTIAGRVVLVAEGRGSKLRVRGDATPAEVTRAAQALAARLVARQGRARRRDVVVETVDGERAATSRWSDALREAGFKGMGTGLRYYVGYDK